MLIRRLACLCLAASAWAQARDGSWIDAERIASWNLPRAGVPRAPALDAEPIDGPRCRRQLRAPAGAPDRAVVAAGWSLVGPLQEFSGTVVVGGAAAADGMCRPLDYQLFVFADGRFAGTLSPVPMRSREDGVATLVRLLSPTDVSVQFDRYTAADPLCCPSRTSDVTFRVEREAHGPLVVPRQAVTTPTTTP